MKREMLARQEAAQSYKGVPKDEAGSRENVKKPVRPDEYHYGSMLRIESAP